jgi:NAD+ kinase
MSNRLCLYSSSFNPPGLHHTAVARALAAVFPDVRVIPCGPRPDKPSNNAVPFPFRAALVDLAFHSIPRVTVDLFDLELDAFTRTDDLEARYSSLGEVWHAIPLETVIGGASGKSVIHRWWRDGPRMWHQLRYAIFHHPDKPIPTEDLPPQHMLIPVDKVGSSELLRVQLFKDKQPLESDMDPKVLAFIRRFSLYSLGPARHEGDFPIGDAKFLIETADGYAKAEAWKARLADIATERNPDAILAIGGDGTMLKAVQQHWRLRVPFLGLNAGNLGFLMNESDELVREGKLIDRLIVRLMPMLRARFQRRDGSWEDHLCFNDAWIERQGCAPAWVRVSVNDEVRLEKLICDGALVSTAAGSTAYSRSMGGPPLLADTPAWLVVGSNVMRPMGWKSALLPMNARVRIESIDQQRRPINGCVNGQTISDVVVLEAQISRVATVQLAFSPKHDMARKISDLHFGNVRSI